MALGALALRPEATGAPQAPFAPPFFPTLGASLVLLLAVMNAVHDLRVKEPVPAEPLTQGFVKTLIVLALVALATPIDFVLALALGGSVIAWLWGERRLFILAFIGLVVPSLAILVFLHLFAVPFPDGVFGALTPAAPAS